MHKLSVVVLFILLMFATPLSAAAATVMIDPGHGGSDPGAIGITGLYEKEVNLDISLKLRDELLKRGYNVVMTRTSDISISLQDRIALANQAMPDILVSVHANSYHKPDVSGTLVLYYDNRYPQASWPASEAMIRLSPESKALALSILGGATAATNSLSRGLLESVVYMVRMGSVPSALIETAFLSNKEDEKKLRDDSFRSQMAVGIANGIAQYLPVHFGDIRGNWAQDAILRLYDKGIVQGNGISYEPNRALTRAEFIAMLDRSTPESTEETVPVDQSPDYNEVSVSSAGNGEMPAFSDLTENHWAYESVTKAVYQRWVQGFPDGTLRLDQPITRAEVSVVLDRVLHADGDGGFDATDPFFADVPLNEWFSQAVYRLRNDQIINGVSATTFSPLTNITRAEIAAMIDRYLSFRGSASQPNPDL